MQQTPLCIYKRFDIMEVIIPKWFWQIKKVKNEAI